MRVAFTFIGRKHWIGGYNYLLNLFRVLHEHSRGEVIPILFAGEDASEDDVRQFQNLSDEPIVRSNLLNRSNRLRRLIKPILLGKDRRIESLFIKHRIDVVFENAAYYGWRFRIPALTWIPDLQHRRMPEMFDFASYWRRELGFLAQVMSGRTIMVSSESAKKDCEFFYPRSRGRVYAVPFAVMPDKEVDKLDAERIKKQYNMPDDFFYLPNQFWKHKNHQVVIDAVRLLKLKGIEVTVAASGPSLDPRHPEHYETLKGRVHKGGIDRNFRFIGMVPYTDLLSLICSSVAVINPSLFEGWSTTVEEAKALKRRLILSDIDVHREQLPGGLFFDPDSPGELASIMESMLDPKKLLDITAATFGCESTENLTRKFAENFVKVISITRQTYMK